MAPENPPDRPAPGRIIVPGAESIPDPEPEASAPSRIILPPGVTVETPEDLPEYPRLRPLVLVPFMGRTQDGQEREMIMVSDPLGVVPGQPLLGAESLLILQLLDGTVSINDLMAVVTRESKDIRVANRVKDFVAQLDRLYMLESPRFDRAWDEIRRQYRQLEIRPAALEGHSYPADPAELRAALDADFAAAEAMRAKAGEPAAAADARPRLILAPHLDPRRAGPALARAYLELGPDPREPLRVVVFGTGHALQGDRFALTRKHFETPLGRVPTDTAFVDRLAGELGEGAYASEIAHRDEHSIEFQAVYLKHRLGGRPFTMVPVLAGGFHDLIDEGRTPREAPDLEALIAAVRDAGAALPAPTVFVAGVDLSHIGPRFGDPPVDERVKQETEQVDRAALAAAVAGDADGWFRAIAGVEDRTRICGFAPTYLALRCAEAGTGRLLAYEQSDEQDTTVVSVAAAVWP